MRKIKKYPYSKILFAIIGLIILYNLLEINVVNNNIDFTVILTFFLIAIISVLNILKDKTKYSLNKTFWYYNLIFNFIAPIVQYLTKYNVWNYELTNDEYFKSNCYILFSQIIYNVIYLKKINPINEKKADKTSINLSQSLRYMLYFISFVCFVLLILNVGFYNLFSRETNNASLVEDSMFNTIFTHLLKCIPVFCFTTLFYENKKINIGKIILLGIIFVVNFPTSTTRFWMGAIFIGIFLILFCDKKSHNRYYDIIIILTFTIVFSMLYQFKFHDISYFIENGFKTFSFIDSYNSVDYDAYSIIPRIIIYVKDNGIVFGKQLIGTVLFFIPRSIWTNKPHPSGFLIAEAANQKYGNISCPFIGEAYLNFGILGIILFQVILGLICYRIDKKFWEGKDNSNYIKIVYPFLMGFLIFLERGALHPAVIYLFCFVLPLIICKIYTIIIRSFTSGSKNIKKNK